MQIRELCEQSVDADMETGAITPVMAIDVATGMMFTIRAVKPEWPPEFEGNRDGGPVVWLEIEEA